MQDKHRHERHVQEPMRGQLYQDFNGKFLRVEQVIHSEVLDGFFIVRLSIGTTQECSDDTWVLGRAEFATLCDERELRLVASGESRGGMLHLASETTGRRTA